LAKHSVPELYLAGIIAHEIIQF